MKLISYNIWHGERLEELMAFLKQEEAEVLALQEMGTVGAGFGREQLNLFEYLKQELGMGGRFERMFWGRTERGEYDLGVAILSRYPILETEKYVYEREFTEERLEAGEKDRYDLPRVLLGVKIEIEGGGAWIYTTHHTITPEATVTAKQLQSSRAVKAYLAGKEEYVLCGDMNTPKGNENYLVLAAGLVDVSGSKPTLHPKIHQVGDKGLHVDYVFLKGSNWRWQQTRIPVVGGSDHLPVVVELGRQ